jgi:hypothetical protein
MHGEAAPMSVRRAIVTALLATGLVGGTAAAAEMFDGRIEPVADETPTTTVPDSTTTTTTAPVADDGEAPEDGEAPDDGEASVERWYEGCGDFTEGNHGEYVRAAAKAEGATGETVSEAAKSPCGKPVSSVHTDPVEEEAEEPVIEPAPDDNETSAHGNGNGQGGGSPGKSGSSQGRGPKK